MTEHHPPDQRGVDSIAQIIDEAEPIGPTPQVADAQSPPSELPESKRERLKRLAGDAVNRHLALFPLTDLGNAERFARRNQSRFMYVPEVSWFAWDGRRWSREGSDALVLKATHETVRAIQDEAEAIRGTEADIVVRQKSDGTNVLLSDAIASWGRASEAAAKLQAIPKHATAYLSIGADSLDADPWRINVLNGTLTVDRSDGPGDVIKLTPHNPQDRITKLAPVVYDPEAPSPTYDQFLKEVIPEADTRRFLHQWGGYSLTGDIAEQKLCFFYGKGKNGKSTLVDAWGAVAGDYGETVPIETFLNQGRGRNAGAATPDLAILPGVRFLRTSEPEKGAKLAEALIKLVTGGEPIQARHLNLGYFKFRPSFKLTMSGNYRPAIDGTDEGIWRRVTLVPWLVTVEKPDRGLPERLKQETSGILNRLLDGLRDYVDNGLITPALITEATASYRDDSDPLGRFLRVAVEPAPGERVQSTVMHRAFLAWGKGAGEREWSAKGLAMALKERGYRSLHSNVMWWLDTRLTATGFQYVGTHAPHPSEVADDD